MPLNVRGRATPGYIWRTFDHFEKAAILAYINLRSANTLNKFLQLVGKSGDTYGLSCHSKIFTELVYP